MAPNSDQPRAVLRPRPFKSFRDRTTQVAMSSDFSCRWAAKLGAQMMSFLYKPDDVHKAEFDTYRAAFRQQHGKAPKAPLLALMTICDSDAERARENAERHCAMYFHSVMHHYEMMSEHFAKTKGYAEYGAGAEAMRAAGLDDMVRGYVDQQLWGTPDRILRKLEGRRATMGDIGCLCAFRFGASPFEVSERSMRLFAKEVLPVAESLAGLDRAAPGGRIGLRLSPPAASPPRRRVRACESSAAILPGAYRSRRRRG